MTDADEPERPHGSVFKGKRSKNCLLLYKRRRGNDNQKKSETLDVFHDAIATNDAATIKNTSISYSKATKRKILPNPHLHPVPCIVLFQF